MSVKEIQKETGYRKKIIEDLKNRHETTEHKRHLPPVGKVNLEYR